MEGKGTKATGGDHHYVLVNFQQVEAGLA